MRLDPIQLSKFVRKGYREFSKLTPEELAADYKLVRRITLDTPHRTKINADLVVKSGHLAIQVHSFKVRRAEPYYEIINQANPKLQSNQASQELQATVKESMTNAVQDAVLFAKDELLEARKIIENNKFIRVIPEINFVDSELKEMSLVKEYDDLIEVADVIEFGMNPFPVFSEEQKDHHILVLGSTGAKLYRLPDYESSAIAA